MAKWGRLAFFYRHPWKSKKKPCLRELYYSLVMSESVQERRIQLPRPRNFTSHQIRISNIKSKLPRKRNSQNPLYVSVFPNFNSQKFWASILIPISNFQILWVSRIPKIPTQTSSQLTSIPKPWNSLDLQDLQHFQINFASVTIAILRFPNSLDLQNFQDLQRKKKKKRRKEEKISPRFQFWFHFPDLQILWISRIPKIPNSTPFSPAWELSVLEQMTNCWSLLIVKRVWNPSAPRGCTEGVVSNSRHVTMEFARGLSRWKLKCSAV